MYFVVYFYGECFNTNLDGDKMIVTRNVLLSDKSNSMELPITEDQLVRWIGGEPATKVFEDQLTPEQILFLVTGVETVPTRVLELESSEYRRI